MMEETGLTFTVYEDGEAAYRRPFFMGAGFTDESCNAVFGYATGQINQAHMEDTETIQVLVADKKEATRILREEKVCLLYTSPSPRTDSYLVCRLLLEKKKRNK